MKPCPYCAEPIQDQAIRCRYCGSDLPDAPGGRRAWDDYDDDYRARSGTNLGLWIGLGVAGVLVVGVVLMVLFSGSGGFGMRQDATYRTQCKHNLKQIGLALHNYHDVNKSFPPAYVTDSDGKPLYSWRVLILPYLEQSPLYEQFDKTKAWDDPTNRRILEMMPEVFACPSAGERGTTTNYAAAFGPNCVFHGPTGTSFSNITDGASNTLIVGEVHGAAIPWTAPTDVDVTQHTSLGDPQGFHSKHEGGCNVLLADGSVRFIANTIHPQTLQHLVEMADGEAIPHF